MSEFTPRLIRQVLDLDLGPNDSGQPTVRGYLVRLLAEVWTEGEGFSGKRPFGNSSWEYDLYLPLVKAELVTGKLDEDGYIEQVDEAAADALILAAINALDAPALPDDAWRLTPAGEARADAEAASAEPQP